MTEPFSRTPRTPPCGRPSCASDSLDQRIGAAEAGARSAQENRLAAGVFLRQQDVVFLDRVRVRGAQEVVE